jgi:hypothetical protein
VKPLARDTASCGAGDNCRANPRVVVAAASSMRNKLRIIVVVGDIDIIWKELMIYFTSLRFVSVSMRYLSRYASNPVWIVFDDERDF